MVIVTVPRASRPAVLCYQSVVTQQAPIEIISLEQHHDSSGVPNLRLLPVRVSATCTWQMSPQAYSVGTSDFMINADVANIQQVNCWG